MAFCITQDADKGYCVMKSSLWGAETWGHCQDFVSGQLPYAELLKHFRVSAAGRAQSRGTERHNRPYQQDYGETVPCLVFKLKIIALFVF